MDKFFKVFQLLFPRSDAFSLFINKRLSQFIKGLSALPQDLKEYIQNIYLDLFPDTTRLLDEWEDQFGISKTSKTESDRRMDVDTVWKAQGGQSALYIQNTLQNAGFDVQVHENNPPADPNLFLNSVPVLFCGGPAAYAGNDQAFAGKTGGELLVNGPILTNIPLYLSICGASQMSCGNASAVAGQFIKFSTKDRIYQIPDDPNLWGGFFFVGGDAERDPIANELISIENVGIPSSRKAELIRLLLKLKPVQSWAGLMINFE